MKQFNLFLFIFVLALVPQFIIAQRDAARPFNAAILGGINASQIDGDASAGYNKLGIGFGLRGIVNFTPKTALYLELEYEQRGSRNNIDQEPFKIKTDYIQIPVLFAYRDWYIEDDNYYKVEAFAGLIYGRLFKQSGSNFPQVVIDNFRKNDLCWQLGVGFNATKHVGLNFRYTHSVIPFFSPNDNGLNSNSLIHKYLTFQGVYTF
ncbi:MAG: PorT family protein [Saprospiraceae bacterium]|nr:PorT family protein [Saprospiraceae bacterium]